MTGDLGTYPRIEADQLYHKAVRLVFDSVGQIFGRDNLLFAPRQPA